MCLSFHLRSAQVVWLMRKLSRPSTLSSFPKGVNTYVFHYINRCVYWFSKFILFILSIFYYSLRCHHIRPFPVQCIWSWQKWLHSFWGEKLFTHSASLLPTICISSLSSLCPDSTALIGRTLWLVCPCCWEDLSLKSSTGLSTFTTSTRMVTSLKRCSLNLHAVKLQRFHHWYFCQVDSKSNKWHVCVCVHEGDAVNHEVNLRHDGQVHLPQCARRSSIWTCGKVLPGTNNKHIYV